VILSAAGIYFLVLGLLLVEKGNFTAVFCLFNPLTRKLAIPIRIEMKNQRTFDKT
jgi:hypothetical protein